jgi:hypothetical protein
MAGRWQRQKRFILMKSPLSSDNKWRYRCVAPPLWEVLAVACQRRYKRRNLLHMLSEGQIHGD